MQKFTRIQKNAKKVKERENKETVKDPEFFENSEKKKKGERNGRNTERQKTSGERMNNRRK